MIVFNGLGSLDLCFVIDVAVVYCIKTCNIPKRKGAKVNSLFLTVIFKPIIGKILKGLL